MINIFDYVKKSTLCFVVSVLLYFVISKVIFDNVYLTSHLIVDEEFHIPLGQAYCADQYDKWDPKVTTLPGLYLLTKFLLLPFGTCSTYSLRFVSFMSAIVNVFLFYELFKKYDANEWRNVLSSITLAILPPMYFFSHLYYTDVAALTMILAMLALYENGQHFVASIFGFLSVLCRQNNILWVALVTAKYCLTELYTVALYRNVIPGTERVLSERNFKQFLIHLSRRPKSIILNLHIEFWLDLAAYGIVLLTFIIFVILNRGVVVGDKTAHVVSVHVPQLFYFSLFCLVFAWPHFVGEIMNFVVFARRNKGLILRSVAVCMCIVSVNTLVHPYLTADNRHYIFYIWNRFYGKYLFFRYLMVPVYVFSWYVIVKLLYDKNNISFVVFFIPCLVLVLVTQELIDMRYYFIPYVMFRLRIKNSTCFKVVLEFVTYCVINIVTLNLFYNKTIVWEEYAIPQRLIW